MDALTTSFLFLQKSIFAVGPFFLLLGVLIFIHELGHFLAARYFGVRVEVFSLGFGPKILKYKKGDTVYCISLLPLGGYVKMFGDNPLKEVSDSEKAQGFLYQKVPAKWLIAFAGPLMNLIFTVLAFFLLALSGISTLPPELGDVPQNSKAHLAGFRSGDKILSVNNQSLADYGDLDEIIKTNIQQTLSFKVRSLAGEMKSLKIVPDQIKNPNFLEWRKSIGAVEGLSPLSTGLKIGVIHDSPAHKAGLRTFDEIIKVNDKNLRYWRELKKLEQNWNRKSLSFTVKRDEEQLVLKVAEGADSLSALGVEPVDLYIAKVGPDTPAERAGLKKGDRLVAINKKPVKSWGQVLDHIKSYSGEPFFVRYQRQGLTKTVSLSPESLFVEGNIKKRFMLGIVSEGTPVVPKEIKRKRGAGQALIYSIEETGKWLSRITAGLIRLIQGDISLRTMGGPVAIGRAAHSSFQQGFQSFLFIMALISLNLFYLNLLPIPMLDGGHLLFFTIEGFLRRPLSVKKLLLAQQVGLVILLSFMSFAVFNDIYNWLKAW